MTEQNREHHEAVAALEAFRKRMQALIDQAIESKQGGTAVHIDVKQLEMSEQAVWENFEDAFRSFSDVLKNISSAATIDEKTKQNIDSVQATFADLASTVNEKMKSAAADNKNAKHFYAWLNNNMISLSYADVQTMSSLLHSGETESLEEFLPSIKGENEQMQTMLSV